MINDLKYFVGGLLSIPLLPLMYYQGKRIRAKVPELPEATGTVGLSNANNAGTHEALSILTIGESTIAGVGVDTHAEGFSGSLGNELSRLFDRPVQWKVYAQNGYTARMVDTQIIPVITEQQVDLIFIGLGGNDAFTLNRPGRWRKHIESLIKSIQDKYPDTDIIFCNMPPIKEFPAFTPLIKSTIGNLVDMLGDELRKAVDLYDNVYYSGEKITIEAWSKRYHVSGQLSDFFSDGVHPSKLTYQIWAKDVAHKVYNNKELKNRLTQNTSKE